MSSRLTSENFGIDDMRWALAFHPDQIATANGISRLMVAPIQIAEDCLPAARGQGWVVLGTDSDIYPDIDANMQSGPQRQWGDE